jgi:O-antigen/teichoic acid export membrane protein
MRSEAGDQARSYGRAAGLLTAALATAGVLAYVFFAVASHSLNEDDYGQIVVLWSVAFLLVSILFRPVEQLLARTIADLQERGQSIQHASRVAAWIQLALGACFFVAALGLKPRLENDVFGGTPLFFWVLVGAVLAFSASYYVRGFFAGSRRMGAYAALLIVEGAVRLALALVVAVGISHGTDLTAIAIAVAPLASLIVVPFALRGHSRPAVPTEPPPAQGLGTAVEGAPEFTLAQGGGFAAAVLLIMLSEQVLLNSGVLFVRGSEGVAAAGFIFNILMIARAPVVLFQAVAASLLPHLTRLRSRGNETSDEAFALSIRMTIVVIVGFSTTVLLSLLLLGPTVMQLAFSDKFEYDRTELAIVGVGMGLYLAAATLNQAALAHGQVRRAALCWVMSSAVFVAINLTSAMDAFLRVEVGFAASAALLCISLFVLYRSPSAESGFEIQPGSSSEVEARLAAADDVS